jgi:hypothetical protein
MTLMSRERIWPGFPGLLYNIVVWRWTIFCALTIDTPMQDAAVSTTKIAAIDAANITEFLFDVISAWKTWFFIGHCINQQYS